LLKVGFASDPLELDSVLLFERDEALLFELEVLPLELGEPLLD
jgi:hypothetical protein